ncbi:MAG TPA: hypothetical protein VFW80_13840 [Gaiellaceae bacterium]|nr:hypothetical protein [Gaiellaceae bacterium]
MHGWVQDIETLEAINQDDLVRRLVLRMAGLARGGKLPGFVEAVGSDVDLDPETKATVLELAADETFLLAAEDYLRATRVQH